MEVGLSILFHFEITVIDQAQEGQEMLHNSEPKCSSIVCCKWQSQGKWHSIWTPVLDIHAENEMLS